jgi:hypothetical protein
MEQGMQNINQAVGASKSSTMLIVGDVLPPDFSFALCPGVACVSFALLRVASALAGRFRYCMSFLLLHVASAMACRRPGHPGIYYNLLMAIIGEAGVVQLIIALFYGDQERP